LKYLSAMARFGVIVCAVSILGLTLVRQACGNEPNRAEAAFQEGRGHLAAGHYPEACKSFRESLREDPASGTLLALAYCEELSGHLASAWANYRAAAELAQKEGHEERRGAATNQVNALATRVSVLTIVVPPPVMTMPGLRVTLDGTEIAPAAYGTPLPVDGGTYRVEAAVGNASWSASVSVQGERDKQVVVVELRAPVVAPAPPRAAARPRKVARPSSTGIRPNEDSKAGGVLPYFATGAAVGGGVGLVLGIGFGLAADSRDRASYRDGHCDDRGCDPRGIELRNGALRAARVSTWSFVVGGALAVASGALYVGYAYGKPSGPRVVAIVDQGSASIGIGKGF
jgi:hypothetical protein